MCTGVAWFSRVVEEEFEVEENEDERIAGAVQGIHHAQHHVQPSVYRVVSVHVQDGKHKERYPATKECFKEKRKIHNDQTSYGTKRGNYLTLLCANILQLGTCTIAQFMANLSETVPV